MRQLDFLVLFTSPIVALVVSLGTHAGFLVSTLLFFGIPATWLSLRSPHKVSRAAIFTFVFIVPLVIFADYIGTVNQAWFVPHSLFPFRLFGIIPMEDFVWGLLFAYTPIMFYEHLLDTGKHRTLASNHMRQLIGILAVVLITFLVVLSVAPGLLRFPYAYAALGVIFLLLPLLAIGASFSHLIKKMALVAAYFFPLALLFELTGLHLEQWTFPGDSFVGWIELAGFRFPLEEFFFWLVIGSAAMVGYYEYFADDRT